MKGKQPSVMTHQFSRVPHADIPRSRFDRSHGYKTTFDAGFLVPILADEALPGDTFNCRMTGFARMATPIFPIMDNLYLETFFFAVPYRLVWDNWERFCGSQDNPSDSTDFTVPTLNTTNGSNYAIYDYFGIPDVNAFTVNALHFRAYNLIYDEWFRDQNLQDSVVVNTDDGPDSNTDYTLLRRGKRHDYFTSCLPFPQKGPSVDIPLGTQAPIVGIGVRTPPTFTPNVNVNETGGNNTTYANADSDIWADLGASPSSGFPQIYADLTNATAATINQLRQSFQIQKLWERDARGGTRYTEVIRAHFRVTSPDQRLQRPEFLGGGSSPVIINQVEQTSESSGTPQGNLAAYGVASMEKHGFVKSFTEHCLIIGLVNCRADLTYQQGLDRMWSRQTRFDYYWPALAHIGEQEVLNKEIFADGTAADENVFGYQERFAEYRYKPSKITGLFRSSAAGTLDSWHLSQEFASLPVLGDTFIQDDPPIDRVIAVPSEPHFIFDSYFNMHCARPMPLYGVPGNIDRF